MSVQMSDLPTEMHICGTRITADWGHFYTCTGLDNRETIDLFLYLFPFLFFPVNVSFCDLLTFWVREANKYAAYMYCV